MSPRAVPFIPALAVGALLGLVGAPLLIKLGAPDAGVLLAWAGTTLYLLAALDLFVAAHRMTKPTTSTRKRRGR